MRRGAVSKVAFVAPTDFSCHSMLHQTLTPPFLQFPFHHHHHPAISAAAGGFLHPPPPPPTATPPRASTQTMQGESESSGMEVVGASAIKKARRQEAPPPPEPQQQQQKGILLPDDVVWAASLGGLLGEEFSVDDLLDFEGLDTDKEEAEAEVEDGTKGDAFLEKKEAAGDSLPPPPAAPPLSDINFPAHDAAEFEWMNSIMDDSVPEYPLSHGVAPYRPSSETTTRSQFKAHRREPKQELGWAEYMLSPPPSPEATIVCMLSTEDLVPVKAKRSKRLRTAGNSWPNLSAGAFTDSSSATTTSSPSSSCSSASSPSSNYFFLYDSHHPAFLPSPPKMQHKPKKRGRKPKHHAAADMVGSGDRRCTHCGSQKTPQWRAGPAGPKTLCNACGVRYKSGRLVPEYRPAASPTFVSHVHSNSHRKVLEMRRKKEEEHVVVSASPAVATF